MQPHAPGAAADVAADVLVDADEHVVGRGVVVAVLGRPGEQAAGAGVGLEVRVERGEQLAGGEHPAFVDEVADGRQAVGRVRVAVRLQRPAQVADAAREDGAPARQAVVVEHAGEEAGRLAAGDLVGQHLVRGHQIDEVLDLARVGVPEVLERREILEPPERQAELPAGGGAAAVAQRHLQRLEQVHHPARRADAAMLQDVLAAAVGHVLLRLVPPEPERVLDGRDVDVVVVEDREGAAFGEHVERLGHQRGGLPVVEPERELRLGGRHGAGGLHGEQREPVGVRFVRPASPADHDAVVDHRVAVGHEPPERLQQRERLVFGEDAVGEVGGEEVAHVDVHPAVVAAVRREGVEPEELQRLAQVTRRPLAKADERGGDGFVLPRLLADGGGRLVAGLALVEPQDVCEEVEGQQHRVEERHVAVRLGGLEPPLPHLAPEARQPERDEPPEVERLARHAVEGKGDAEVAHPVVGRQPARHLGRVGRPQLRRRALGRPERDHLVHAPAIVFVEVALVQAPLDLVGEAVEPERRLSPLVRAEPDQRVIDAPGEEIGGADLVEEVGELRPQARDLAQRGVRVAVAAVGVGESELGVEAAAACGRRRLGRGRLGRGREAVVFDLVVDHERE